MNIETTVSITVLPDQDPDTSYLEQDGFEDRLAAYRAGDFAHVGVRAEVIRHDWTSGTVTSVTSAGLWGIESDSGADYYREVGREELDSLRDELARSGISTDGIEPQLRETV